MFKAFNQKEIDKRVNSLRVLMRNQRLKACIISSPENIFYFSGYDSWVSVNSPQALLIVEEDSIPCLLVRDVDLYLVMETAQLIDIRTYNLISDSYADHLRVLLAEKFVTRGRVGIELGSYAVPTALGDSLRKHLKSLTIIDSTLLLGDQRHIKSPTEIFYLEEAGKFANFGLETLYDSVKNGCTEISLAADIEFALRSVGSDFWSIPTELSSGNRTVGCHATPRNKKIRPGELIHVEFAGVSARYHAVAIQTLAFGSPSAKAKELYDIGIASLNAGISSIRPGVSVSKVEEASLEPLRAHGLEHAAMMRFGYGIGIAYPPVWLETLQITRGSKHVLKKNMVFVMHSCLQLLSENLGIIQGGTWILEETGLRMLAGAGPCALKEINI